MPLRPFCKGLQISLENLNDARCFSNFIAAAASSRDQEVDGCRFEACGHLKTRDVDVVEAV